MILPGNDTPLSGWVCDALHTERLPTACLTIGKDCPIVAFGNSLQLYIQSKLDYPNHVEDVETILIIEGFKLMVFLLS